MKAIYVSLLAAASILSAGAAHADAALAQAKGCLACHDVATPKIGPTYKDVAAKYAGKGAEKTLADHIMKGTGAGVGWQAAGKASMPMMPANPSVNADEAAKLVKWILSQK